MSENVKNINKDKILNQTSHLIECVENAYNTGKAAHKAEQDIIEDGAYVAELFIIRQLKTLCLFRNLLASKTLTDWIL